jgi:Flp pilus assembly protein TadG
MTAAGASRKRRGQRGQAMIEMSLCMIVLFFMIFGIFQYSQISFANNFCSFAAQQGARYAAIRGVASANALPTNPSTCGTSCTNVSSGDPTTAFVQGLAVGLNTANLTVTTAWGPSGTGTAGNAAGSTVTVTVKYVLNPILAVISANSFTLSSAATWQVLL